MKIKRISPAIAMALVLALGACADAVGPTGQGPDAAQVLDGQNDDSRDANHARGPQPPLEQQ